jgi:holo-[acyl-carrier protein] synthase
MRSPLPVRLMEIAMISKSTGNGFPPSRPFTTHIRTGVDLVQVQRIADLLDKYGERFARRVFSDRELSACGRRTDRLAARFAAKEAVSKALGTGIGRVSWREIEIVNDDAGRPKLELSGRAEELAVELDLREWSISLSHTQEQAIAFVIAAG